MEDTIEVVVESANVSANLADLPVVDQSGWERMTRILDELDLNSYKYKKPVPWEGKKFPARITRVYDADTVYIVFVNERGTPEMVSVRLHLIDAPEIRCGKGVSKLQKATGLSVTEYVRKLLPVGSLVTVAVREHCIYNNRVIGAIFIKIHDVETDLSVHLLKQQLVKSYCGDKKREPWSDDELFAILRRIPEYQTEEAKDFILHGVNSRSVSLGAAPPKPVDTTSASMILPVLDESKSEGKKKEGKKEGKKQKKQQQHQQQQSPGIPFSMPPNQMGATMIIPQSWFQPQAVVSAQGNEQPSPSAYPPGVPVFMPYPYMTPAPTHSYGRGRGGRGRGR